MFPFQGVFQRRGAAIWTPLPGFSCRVPGGLRVPLVAVGLGLAKRIAFLRAPAAPNCSYMKQGLEGLAQLRLT